MTIFHEDTTLYHPTEGSKVFPKGEQHPGPAWSRSPAGDVAGKDVNLQAMRDLITAQEQNELLTRALASRDHDIAQRAKEAAEALAQVHGLEQAVIAAEAAKIVAEITAAELTAERDAARAEATRYRDRIQALEGDLGATRGQIAAMDADGDGVVGGAAKPDDPEVPALRAAYKERFGKKAFAGWDSATLREKLAAEPVD